MKFNLSRWIKAKCYKFDTEELEDIMNLGFFNYCIKEKRIHISKGVKKILHKDSHKITPEEFQEYIIPEDIDLVKEIFKDCINKKENKDIQYKMNIEGELYFIRIVLIYTKKIIKGIIKNISFYKNIELELEEKKSKAFYDLNKKTSFITNMSHEIRTPLNGIIGMTSLLRETPLDADQADYVDTVIESSGMLLSVINNILDYSRIENGTSYIVETPVNIKHFLFSIKNYYNKCKKKDSVKFTIDIKEDVPESISMDKLKMQQVINNIINNSVKFTKQGCIKIIVSKSEDKKFIVYTINDTGIGMSEEFQRDIFKPFLQEAKIDEIYTGTGLGLSVCKKLVDLMEGSIKINSVENIGTSIILRLPLKQQEQRIQKTHNGKTVVDTLDKVALIVEDNSINQRITLKLLKKLQFKEIMVFDKGDSLISYIEKSAHKITPLFIFMDIHMPGLNGYDTTRFLRRNDIKCNIIGLTANAMEGTYERCIESGMNDMILKPVSLQAMNSILKKNNILSDS